MIDIENETLIDISTAARHPALANPKTGKAVHAAAVYRLIQHGARSENGQRVRLESVRVPGGLRTSIQAIGRLVARLTDPDDGADPVITPGTRREQISAARERLAAAGIA